MPTGIVYSQKVATCHVLKGTGKEGPKERARLKSSFRFEGTIGLLAQLVKLIIDKMMPSSSPTAVFCPNNFTHTGRGRSEDRSEEDG
jgi:hypothetical protein